MHKFIKINTLMAAIFFIFASMIVISSTASALTFSNSKTTSSSGKSTKNKEIKIYDVEFSEKVSKELLSRIVAKTDFDFSQYSLANDISKKCRFNIRRVEYDKVNEGEVQNRAIMVGSLTINSGIVTLNNDTYWKQGGLSKDKSYLDEFNVRLTKDGHFVGKMAFFLWSVDPGEVPMSPLYPELTKHKNNKPFGNDMKNAEFWIDVADWAGGVMFVNLCKNSVNSIKSSNAFDERYSFNILRQGVQSTKSIGSGYIEINNGIMTVAKDGRNINVDSVDLYDSFEGRIDKKGNISARFTMYPMCGAFRLQDLEFNGNINAQLKTKCGESSGFDLYALLELKKE